MSLWLGKHFKKLYLGATYTFRSGREDYRDPLSRWKWEREDFLDELVLFAGSAVRCHREEGGPKLTLMTFSTITIWQGSRKYLVPIAYLRSFLYQEHVVCYGALTSFSAPTGTAVVGRRVRGYSLPLQYRPSSAGHSVRLPRQSSKSRPSRVLVDLASVHIVSLFQRVNGQDSNHDDSDLDHRGYNIGTCVL